MKLLHFAVTLAIFTSLSASAEDRGSVKIYDSRLIGSRKLVLLNGKKQVLRVSSEAQAVSKNLTIVRDYFFEQFGRRSWDGKGSQIIASVRDGRFLLRDRKGRKQNAAWLANDEEFLFGTGSRKGIDNLEGALDVVAHEYTHAVIQTSSDLLPEGQSGALNEHLADVFGVIINARSTNPRNPYLIGATVLFWKDAQRAHALRDLLNPEKGLPPHPSRQLPPQPSHMKDLEKGIYGLFGLGCNPEPVNDYCGIHILSGIPNRMAALVMTRVGPERAAPIFYNVMTKRLKPDADFADYRVALMEECRLVDQEICAAVDESLKAVGI